MTIASVGGVHQYSETMLSVLADLRESRSEDFLVLADNLLPGARLLDGRPWEIERLTPATGAERLLTRARLFARDRLSVDQRETLRGLGGRLRRSGPQPPPREPTIRRDVHEWLERLGVGLVIHPAPRTIAFEAGVPYVLAVHDLQHRLHPEFPEVSADGEWEYREHLFRNGIGGATMVLVDSDVGKEDVLELYGDLIAPERVAVLPFLPATPPEVSDADRERVRRAHRLPERFLFYPAQLWPHKNHLSLVEALGLLAREGLEIDLVLVGARSGPIREDAARQLADRARELGLEHHIHHLGYVPAEDMAALYAEAVALVMPTFFGPTNIPILEAWSLGCPVLTSDIRGVREQAGDAALLADPRSVEEIAAAIRRLWEDDALRADLVERGRRRRGLYTREDYARRLDAVLDQATALLRKPNAG